MTRIAIIDDHKLVSAGFSHLIELEDELSVACICSSYEEAISLIDDSIDVAVIDISMPGNNGIELAKYLDEKLPSIKKLIVSMYANPHYIKEAKQYGVLAYLSKKSAPNELIDAINTIINGDEYYPTEILKKLKACNKLTLKKPLTNRELNVLKVLAKNLSPKQVASELDVTHKTILAHRYNLYNKFDVNNQFDLLQKALEFGLLTSTDISLCSV
ncbi:response regulator transcription factor [Thalassotalea sp. SU-HH00458]|uniref:response regulator transcription factor n=1 Tax=Thalassotalea sp. SU-HH00458 TaxID=3127657 RepID=UPI0031081173